tara:strand:+ start:1968 stop:2657 length:690 start_codon:yes stop_codon:yes gene_type:complete
MNFNIDLKNLDLKNITMEDIKAKLQNVEKKTWIKVGVSFGAVVLFLIIFYGVLNPIVNKKKAQLIDMDTKQKETQEFINQIGAAKNKINKLKPRYEQYSTLFHSRAEVEGLYQTLSEFAGMNDLIISKIVKGKIKEVSKNQALAEADGKKAKTDNKKKKLENIAYYSIPVDFEITGNFLGYIKFKRQLSMSQKMLNFDKESIQVVKGNTTGAIKVNGTLTIVGLADEFF